MKKPSQAEKLLTLLRDGQPHSTIDIMAMVYGGSHLGVARIGARIHDLRSKGHEIEGRRDPANAAIYIYQMKVKPKPRVEVVERDGVRYGRVLT